MLGGRNALAFVLEEEVGESDRGRSSLLQIARTKERVPTPDGGLSSEVDCIRR
jgi:hypothetical protein